MAGAAGPHFRGISVKNSLIVGFSVFGEKFYDLWVHMVAVIFAGLYRHTDAAVRLKRSFKGLVCLETYNGFLIFIQVAGAVGSNGGYDPGIHVQDAAFGLFFLCQLHDLFPQVFRSLGRALEKIFISVIGSVVFLDKVPDIDLFFPDPAVERFPFFEHVVYCLLL